MAPAKGCDAPHIRFCIAIEKPKTSRPQPISSLIGTMKMPKLVRVPKARISTIVPAARITAGVRQLEPSAIRSLSARMQNAIIRAADYAAPLHIESAVTREEAYRAVRLGFASMPQPRGIDFQGFPLLWHGICVTLYGFILLRGERKRECWIEWLRNFRWDRWFTTAK
jgi:hypothetical protein